MSDTPEIIALVGSYRKGGMNDQIVDAILAGARERGARIRKISLVSGYKSNKFNWLSV
ncbi:hypothetical protein [Prosthecochloris sp. ZM]|uniref:hypothetical protein n=1 Tax=Prosthecochloris sp. ZM TaxID=2283143 RepID=UPI001FC9F74B|nr:hypothetical protein [Prosthecochloris sp. ZM]